MTNKKSMFDLQTFMPYRVAVLENAISNSIAQLYTDKFKLTRSEWRVLAALGNKPGMVGKEVVLYTTQDKVQVSRAVIRLESKGFIVTTEDPNDRRNKNLCLSKKGEKLLAQIIPLILEQEQFLLDSISEEERRQFVEITDKILVRAREIISK